MIVPFKQATKTFAKIGLLSFGGPAGQIATMHRILVEEKRWVEDSRFLHALNYCMLLPGPEAMQLSVYLGWLLNGGWGGLAAGLLFVLPGVCALMGLSVVYALLGHVSVVGADFFGQKAAVIAIVLHAVRKLAAKSLKTPALLGLAALSFVAIFFFNLPFPLIILAAAAVGAASGGGPVPGAGPVIPQALPGWGRAAKVLALWMPLWLAPVVGLYGVMGADNVFADIAVFFSKMAVVTFGGAYAVLAYVAQEAVQNFHWLSQGEMLDGLGMAETTPGPLIMVLQFVGFMAAYRDPGTLTPLAAGILGGLLTSWVTFTPCFLWIFLGAPYVEYLRGNAVLSRMLAAISAAVVGVILNLGVWFALHTLFRTSVRATLGPLSLDVPVWSSLDPWSLGLSVAALLALFRFRVGMVVTLAACSAAGVALHLVL